MNEQLLTPKQRKYYWYVQKLLEAAERIMHVVRKDKHELKKFLLYLKRAEKFMIVLEEEGVPIDFESYYVLGMHYMKAFDYNGARRIFERGMRLAKKLENAHYLNILGRLAKEAKKATGLKSRTARFRFRF